jgi:hypothetical protein
MKLRHQTRDVLAERDIVSAVADAVVLTRGALHPNVTAGVLGRTLQVLNQKGFLSDEDVQFILPGYAPVSGRIDSAGDESFL